MSWLAKISQRVAKRSNTLSDVEIRHEECVVNNGEMSGYGLDENVNVTNHVHIFVNPDLKSPTAAILISLKMHGNTPYGVAIDLVHRKNMKFELNDLMKQNGILFPDRYSPYPIGWIREELEKLNIPHDGYAHTVFHSSFFDSSAFGKSQQKQAVRGATKFMQTVETGTLISTRPEVREAMVRKMQETLKIDAAVKIGTDGDLSRQIEGRG